MVVVIFEVWPKEGHRPEYLDIAAQLRPELEAIDGFISVERFESASTLRSPTSTVWPLVMARWRSASKMMMWMKNTWPGAANSGLP